MIFMKLIQLVYCSQLDPQVPPAEVAKIHEVALANNAKLEITGALFFGDDCFLQCLEGGDLSVNQVYNKIVNDKRHRDCVILGYRETEKRQFEDWSMKLVLLTERNARSIRRYSSTGRFQPHQMSFARVMSFIEDFKAN